MTSRAEQIEKLQRIPAEELKTMLIALAEYAPELVSNLLIGELTGGKPAEFFTPNEKELRHLVVEILRNNPNRIWHVETIRAMLNLHPQNVQFTYIIQELYESQRILRHPEGKISADPKNLR